MNVYDETSQILKTYRIQANKSLGQNFLVNDEVVEKIIDSAELEKDDLVIEIGPGLGVLTNRLLQKCNNVVCIELDERMIKILKDRFKLYIDGTYLANLEIINEDVLKVNLEELIAEKRKRKKYKNVKVVANLPYHISTPIIMKLLESRLSIDEIIVMVQKRSRREINCKNRNKTCGSNNLCCGVFF